MKPSPRKGGREYGEGGTRDPHGPVADGLAAGGEAPTLSPPLPVLLSLVYFASARLSFSLSVSLLLDFLRVDPFSFLLSLAHMDSSNLSSSAAESGQAGGAVGLVDVLSPKRGGTTTASDEQHQRDGEEEARGESTDTDSLVSAMAKRGFTALTPLQTLALIQEYVDGGGERRMAVKDDAGSVALLRVPTFGSSSASEA